MGSGTDTDSKAPGRASARSTTDYSSSQDVLTICAHCLRGRNPMGLWEVVPYEIYVERPLSHGICADCVRIYYPQLVRS